MPAYVRLCRQRIGHQLHYGFAPLEGSDLPNPGDVNQHAGIGCETLFQNVQLALVKSVRGSAQEFLDG